MTKFTIPLGASQRSEWRNLPRSDEGPLPNTALTPLHGEDYTLPPWSGQSKDFMQSCAAAPSHVTIKHVAGEKRTSLLVGDLTTREMNLQDSRYN